MTTSYFTSGLEKLHLRTCIRQLAAFIRCNMSSKSTLNENPAKGAGFQIFFQENVIDKQYRSNVCHYLSLTGIHLGTPSAYYVTSPFSSSSLSQR